MVSTHNSRWVKIGCVNDFPEGKIIARPFGDDTILVHRLNHQWFAFEPACPHMSRSLQDARITASSLECIWHNMVFDLNTGAIVEDSGFFDIPRLKTYRVRLNGRLVLIEDPAVPPKRDRP